VPRPMKGMFRRGNSWYVRINRGGRDVWRSLGSDYELACTALRKLRADGDSLTSQTTVHDAAKEWFRTYVQNSRSPYCIKQTESRMRIYMEPFFGHLLLQRVTSQHLRSYRAWLDARCKAPATVRHMLSEIRCLLNWAADASYIDRSPFPRRIMPRIEERPPDRLTDSEIEAVVKIPDPHGFVVRLALATGLRWGELTRLNSTDIVQGVFVIHRTKSGKVRRVPIPKWFEPELKLRIGKFVPFASSGQFNAAVCRMSGVERFHVHQLRHTFACRWVERGGSLAALQQMLGHSTVVMTQRYARISDDLVKAEAERLEARSVAESVAESVAAEQ
jgi:integrase